MLRAQALLWLSSFLWINVFCSSRIMGGEETSIEQYPYMAGFERWKTFECASTIIHKRWALTAGHCVTAIEIPEEIFLRVGTSHRGSGGDRIPVFRTFRHADPEENDIALLYMECDIPLGDKVQIVPLPEQDSDVDVGSPGTILGWGNKAPNENSGSTLKRVEITVLDRNACQADTSLLIDEAFLCAGRNNAGEDTCPGDGGGPLIVDGVQVGIIIRPKCSGDGETTMMFANVGHFRQAINNQMKWPPVMPWE